jgi:hypothetical protein
MELAALSLLYTYIHISGSTFDGLDGQPRIGTIYSKI